MEPSTIIKPEKLADYIEVITKAVFEKRHELAGCRSEMARFP
jgi:hypothetical protein